MPTTPAHSLRTNIDFMGLWLRFAQKPLTFINILSCSFRTTHLLRGSQSDATEPSPVIRVTFIRTNFKYYMASWILVSVCSCPIIQLFG